MTPRYPRLVDKSIRPRGSLACCKRRCTVRGRDHSTVESCTCPSPLCEKRTSVRIFHFIAVRIRNHHEKQNNTKERKNTLPLVIMALLFFEFLVRQCACKLCAYTHTHTHTQTNRGASKQAKTTATTTKEGRIGGKHGGGSTRHCRRCTNAKKKSWNIYT
jgi:hypothetical protein